MTGDIKEIDSIGDLKTGMIVELRNGKRAMVMKNTINGDILCGETWGNLYMYKDFVRNGEDKDDYDIVCVRQPQHNAQHGRIDKFYEFEIIWEEKMTITLMGIDYTFTETQAEEIKKYIESL